jgi:hypothetical protein
MSQSTSSATSNTSNVIVLAQNIETGLKGLAQNRQYVSDIVNYCENQIRVREAIVLLFFLFLL